MKAVTGKAVTGKAGAVLNWQRHTVTDFDSVDCPNDLRQVVFQGHASRSMWNATSTVYHHCRGKRLGR
jgi:hypothetical protein